MNLEIAQKMIRFAYYAMYERYRLDQITQLQEFLSDDAISDDFLLTELEDFVAAKLDAKLDAKIEPRVKAAKKIT